MNPDIYQEYDIRGVISEDIKEDEFITMGRGFGTYFNRSRKRRIVVGRDCRLSSPKIRDELKEGLISTGCNVVDVGICPTLILYFAIQHLKANGGIMITVSHNPPHYNGFKVCSGFDTIYWEEIQGLKRVVKEGDFVKGKGAFSSYEIVGPFMDMIRSDIKIGRGIRVGFVWVMERWGL